MNGFRLVAEEANSSVQWVRDVIEFACLNRPGAFPTKGNPLGTHVPAWAASVFASRGDIVIGLGASPERAGVSTNSFLITQSNEGANQLWVTKSAPYSDSEAMQLGEWLLQEAINPVCSTKNFFKAFDSGSFDPTSYLLGHEEKRLWDVSATKFFEAVQPGEYHIENAVLLGQVVHTEEDAHALVKTDRKSVQITITKARRPGKPSFTITVAHEGDELIVCLPEGFYAEYDRVDRPAAEERREKELATVRYIIATCLYQARMQALQVA